MTAGPLARPSLPAPLDIIRSPHLQARRRPSFDFGWSFRYAPCRSGAGVVMIGWLIVGAVAGLVVVCVLLLVRERD